MATRRWNPYGLACALLERGDAVVCIPVETEGERGWAVLHWPPGVAEGHDPIAVAITLICAARDNLRRANITVL